MPLAPSRRPDQGHRAVLAPGAAQGDGQIRLALRLVARDQKVQHAGEMLDERLGIRPAQHVIPHLLIETGLAPQLRHPVRVGQEADIEQEIHDPGHAPLETERYDVDSHPTSRLTLGERMLDVPTQVVHTEIARIDDDVRRTADLLERLAFGGDLVAQLPLANRVRPPRLLVTANQRCVRKALDRGQIVLSWSGAPLKGRRAAR